MRLATGLHLGDKPWVWRLIGMAPCWEDLYQGSVGRGWGNGGSNTPFARADYETPSQQTDDLLLLKSDDDQSRFIDESVASLGMTSGALSGGHSMGEVIDDLSDSLSEQMSFDRCTSRRGR